MSKPNLDFSFHSNRPKHTYRGVPTAIGEPGVVMHPNGKYLARVTVSLASLGEGKSHFDTLAQAIKARNKLYRLLGIPLPKKASRKSR